jgi:hypothetical protein
MKAANMRPSARLALRALALETNDRELKQAIGLLQKRLTARAASDARVG